MPSTILALLVGAVALAGCGSSSSSSSSSRTAAASPSSGSAVLGFENVPLEPGSELAPAGTTQTGIVDGIQCGATEQLAYHIHAHLAVFDNGVQRSLPAGVGIPGSSAQSTSQGPVAAGGQCIYWLHTHTTDGVIHVESPTQRIYTLGNFFDEWHQPLSPDRVGTVTGKITALVNGQIWKQDPRAIPLVPHAVIQLNVGTPSVAFRQVDWSQTQL